MTQQEHSTGRLAESKILKGVLSVTVNKQGYDNNLADIQILDILRSHRPKVAEFVMDHTSSCLFANSH
jgi:hypothetical protein